MVESYMAEYICNKCSAKLKSTLELFCPKCGARDPALNNMEKFQKFCEKYIIVGCLIAYPILLSTIEMQLGPPSKFNLIPIITDLIGWLPCFIISVFVSILAGMHFIGLLWRFYNYLK